MEAGATRSREMILRRRMAYERALTGLPPLVSLGLLTL